MMGRTRVDLSAEAARHGDILQSDYEDTYYNVTLKNIDLLAYVDESCPELDFLFHADDDILLIPSNGAHHLNQLKEGEVSMTGCKWGPDVPPIRDISNKYYANTLMAPDKFPAYLSGAAIFYRADAVKAMIPVRKEVPLIHMSDVFLGQLLQRAQVHHNQMLRR